MAKVIQYHSAVIGADAIGGSIQLLHAALQRAGVDSAIACRDEAKDISVRNAIPASGLLNASFGSSLGPDDVFLIHYSFIDETAEALAHIPAKKVIVFHNVTPGHFFLEAGQQDLARACDAARNQFGAMGNLFDASVGDSDFNSAELRSASYPDVSTIPILIDVEAFRSDDQDLDLLNRVKSAAEVNILFVGRFVPNKRIERVISAVAHFNAAFPATVRLHLVGKIWNQAYFASLVEYAASVSAADLIRFHVNIDRDTLNTLYAAADAFICMSDHEGFMAPIVEAFAAGCPVIALRRTAVGETMGDGGLLVDEPDPELVAGLIHALHADQQLRNRVIWSQGRRLPWFSPERATGLWLNKLAALSAPIAAAVGATSS